MFSRAMVAAALASSLWLPALLAAQAPFGDSWRWTEFTTEAGLPSNAVSDVVEARDGTPWAATDGGVAWYDGFQWHAVSAGEALSTRRPQVLVADPAGGVLVVIHSRLFRGDTTGLRYLPLFIDGAEQAVAGVAPLDDGRILLLVRDLPEAALYLYEGGRLARVSPPTALPGDLIPRLWRTERGTIWLNAAGGLYRWNAGRWVLQLPAPPPGFQVAGLLEGAGGAGLAFIRHPEEARGLWEWTGDRPFRRHTAEGSNELASLDMGPTGEALAVYETGHVRLRRGGAWTPVEPLPPELRNVAFVKFRKTGDLWVGGRTGLYLYRSASARWAGRAHPFPDYRNRINAILRARLAVQHRPDVVVMDIAMPELNGLEAAEQITKECPEVRVLILSMYADEAYVAAALAAGAAGYVAGAAGYVAGAAGYVMKSGGAVELELGLRAVARGQSYLTPAVAKQVLAGTVGPGAAAERRRLTPRQRETLQLIAEGHSTKAIAHKLGVSVKTVETHRAQLMERLDIHDVAGLVRYAIRTKLVPPEA